ncbi:MAG: PPC domain-containing DNA-binding protein [Elusimicrobiota bacterium]
MDYKIEKNILAVRLYEGEDFVAGVREAFKKAGSNLGIFLNAAGMMQNVKLGYFIGKGEYKDNIFSSPREIVSLTGNLINNDSGFYSHLHISLADDDGKTCGGHVQEAQVHGTGEVFIYLSDMEVTRRMEEKTKLEGLKL